MEKGRCKEVLQLAGYGDSILSSLLRLGQLRRRQSYVYDYISKANPAQW